MELNICVEDFDPAKVFDQSNQNFTEVNILCLDACPFREIIHRKYLEL